MKQETQALLALVQGIEGKDWASRRRGWSSRAEEPGKSVAEDFIIVFACHVRVFAYLAHSPRL